MYYIVHYTMTFNIFHDAFNHLSHESNDSNFPNTEVKIYYVCIQFDIIYDG